ncbi:hypothetical protein DFR67_102281 [Williamsia limnetica]|jgi:hypothetical protein|uniref:Uncharacterized protein n=1 Tax=Williamsia limnetica TaxID=882452 RepID=A0A318RQD4_WILLI|nr:hypothetical protein [Williamsia limnetica]PYE20143.1 hypothetical protein DFR67_102281 [Williamsia limnetica]
MTEPQPLIPPFQHNDDSIDAADAGRGAPGGGSIVEGGATVTPEEIEQFNEHLDAERDKAPLFRTPHPEHHQNPKDGTPEN